MTDPDSPTAPTEDAHVKKFRKELNAGTVSLVLLSILAKSDEAMYGYQIAKEMEQSENGQPLVKQGALYPVLRSMSALGLLASRVEPSSSGPPRRYYEITADGRTTLDYWESEWRKTRSFVDAVLGD